MSSFALQGKQIIVTGGSRGIGAEIVRVAAMQGAETIVIGYASNSKAANDLISKLEKDVSTNKTKFYAVQGDLTNQKSCSTFVKNATQSFKDGKFDGLVCCSGVMDMIPLAASTDENLAHHFNVNVSGTLFTIQSALPHINNDGRIIAFSTSVINSPQALQPGYLQYTMCKAAVEQMVKVLQRDPSIGGPERRIAINCVAPGATATELFLKGKSDEIIKRIGSLTPEGRIGQPDEVAEAITFLLTPASRWVRGQLVRINGAQTL